MIKQFPWTPLFYTNVSMTTTAAPQGSILKHVKEHPQFNGVQLNNCFVCHFSNLLQVSIISGYRGCCCGSGWPELAGSHKIVHQLACIYQFQRLISGTHTVILIITLTIFCEMIYLKEKVASTTPANRGSYEAMMYHTWIACNQACVDYVEHNNYGNCCKLKALARIIAKCMRKSSGFWLQINQNESTD